VEADREGRNLAKLRLAIIGCGAVSQRGHLPAAAKMDDVQVALLVDRDRARAEELAARYRVPHVAEDYRKTWDSADAAVVALPHHLHASVSIDLLRRGIHVLVEKPMAPKSEDCEAMIQAAEQARATLAVGHVRRFLRSARFANEVIKGGLLGTVSSFDISDGFVFDWPVVSGFLFRKETAGGGVLMDAGAHCLDLLLWWLGEVRSCDYFDDNLGGVEANCRLELVMRNGAEGLIELSRTRRLRNTAIIRGERASLEVHLYSNRARIRPNGVSLELPGEVRPDAGEGASNGSGAQDIMSEQLSDWIHAIRTGGTPKTAGEDGRATVALVERCYRGRKPLAVPWMETESVDGETIAGKTPS